MISPEMPLTVRGYGGGLLKSAPPPEIGSSVMEGNADDKVAIKVKIMI
jgi:hypothetical protein